MLQPTILNHSLCNFPLPFSPLEVSHFFPTLERYDRRNTFRFAFRCVSACIKELRRAWETHRWRPEGVPKISSPNFFPKRKPNKNTQILTKSFPEKVQLHPRETLRKFQQKTTVQTFFEQNSLFHLGQNFIHPQQNESLRGFFLSLEIGQIG